MNSTSTGGPSDRSLHALIPESAGSKKDARTLLRDRWCGWERVLRASRLYDLVTDLKKVLKAPKPNKIHCEDADDLQLFLAKKNGAWLVSDSADVISMQSGTIPERLNGLLHEEIDPAKKLGGLFKDAPTKKAIHVLVKVPEGAGVGVGQDVRHDRMHVPAAVPTGPDVNLSSCDELLAFLENEMTNKEALVSRPHILQANSLQFRLVGREEAITAAVKCFSNFVAFSGVAGTDRIQQAVPVCSGISGLGKTRMLDESGTILKEMGLNPDLVFRVIVSYYNGFSPQSVERTMPIEASFSWRLLYRFFLDKNCACLFVEWSESRQPCNGGLLPLRRAVKVIERKLRQRVRGNEKLYLFLGVDEYQKIENVNAPRKDPDTSLLRELVEAIVVSCARNRRIWLCCPCLQGQILV